ncbi:hypothetical protein AI27_06490 [Sphingomonas sp. BHC-A]|nr:hypothetical protein AI27_06490 [Sphingomonas sp. BHC-A]
MTARIRRRFDPLFWPRFVVGLLRLRKAVPAFTPEQEARLRALIADMNAKAPRHKSIDEIVDSYAGATCDRIEAVTEHSRLRRQIERGADAER